MGSMKKPRVLLVDDDRDILDSLDLLLSGEYDVTVAYDGNHALSLIQSGNRFDAMVLDLMMPGLDGVGLLRALQGARRFIPTVIASARQDVADVARAHGVSEHVTKPFDIRTLRTKLARILKHSPPGTPGGTPPSTPHPSGGQPAGASGPSEEARARAPSRPVAQRPVLFTRARRGAASRAPRRRARDGAGRADWSPASR